MKVLPIILVMMFGLASCNGIKILDGDKRGGGQRVLNKIIKNDPPVVSMDQVVLGKSYCAIRYLKGLRLSVNTEKKVRVDDGNKYPDETQQSSIVATLSDSTTDSVSTMVGLTDYLKTFYDSLKWDSVTFTGAEGFVSKGTDESIYFILTRFNHVIRIVVDVQPDIVPANFPFTKDQFLCDTLAPTITSAKVKAGKLVYGVNNLVFGASDAISGLKSAAAEFILPGTDSKITIPSTTLLTDSDGNPYLVFSIDDSTPEGSYVLNKVTMKDNADNETNAWTPSASTVVTLTN